VQDAAIVVVRKAEEMSNVGTKVLRYDILVLYEHFLTCNLHLNYARALLRTRGFPLLLFFPCAKALAVLWLLPRLSSFFT